MITLTADIAVISFIVVDKSIRQERGKFLNSGYTRYFVPFVRFPSYCISSYQSCKLGNKVSFSAKTSIWVTERLFASLRLCQVQWRYQFIYPAGVTSSYLLYWTKIIHISNGVEYFFFTGKSSFNVVHLCTTPPLLRELDFEFRINTVAFFFCGV